MIHVALFRNLNLGHPGSPTGEQLVAAFGGPGFARSFQTNGTVIFHADDDRATTSAATETLRCLGYQQGMVVRSLAELEQAVTGAPEPEPEEDVYRTMISFFDLDDVPAIKVPVRSRDGLVEVRQIARGSAGSVCWKPRGSAGDVTGFLGTLLEVPVTSRTLGTMTRLLATASRMTFPSSAGV